MKIGDFVIIDRKHWLRPKEIGVIVDFNKNKSNQWLIYFDSPGGGFKEEGTDGSFLWLDEMQLEVVNED